MKIAILLVLFASGAYAQPCLHAAKEVAPVLTDQTRELYLKNLGDAEAVHLEKPNELDSIVWLGRRTAYLGRYKDAIRIYSSGLMLFKDNPILLRHRGHRYITIRCFDDAIRDLERAAQMIKGKPDVIEPDGIPNAKNTPTSTLQSNIWYHLGLAYYLKGDFKNASRAYEECEKVSKNPDMRVATSYWHYMTVRRLGNKKKARKILDPINGKMELIENDDYLKLILLSRGEMKPNSIESLISYGEGVSVATLGYGLGAYYLNAEARERAFGEFSYVLQTNQWASFGFIAAEQDIKRVQIVTP